MLFITDSILDLLEKDLESVFGPQDGESGFSLFEESSLYFKDGLEIYSLGPSKEGTPKVLSKL